MRRITKNTVILIQVIFEELFAALSELNRKTDISDFLLNHVKLNDYDDEYDDDTEEFHFGIVSAALVALFLWAIISCSIILF